MHVYNVQEALTGFVEEQVEETGEPAETPQWLCCHLSGAHAREGDMLGSHPWGRFRP
jgi:hypothetical protein